MRFTVVRGSKSGPSSRALRDGLIHLGHDARVDYSPWQDTVGVNWTGSSVPGCINGNTQTNKLRQLEMLRLAGLRTTEFSSNFRPGWMGRTIYHAAGRDFRGRRQRVREFPFYTKPEKFVTEYRLHAVRLGRYGYISKVQQKYNKYPEKNKEFAPGVQIRNRQWGWHMKVVHQDDWASLPGWVDLRGHAIWSMHAQDWDLGAVDLGVLGDNRAVILEVNSCPSLKDDTSKAAYADACVKIARERGM